MTGLVARFAEVTREPEVDLGLACLLISALRTPERAEEMVDTGRRALDELAANVAPTGRADERLRDVLAGYGGSPQAYASLESSLLWSVLRHRQGLPITVSVVWLEVARRLTIPSYGIGLPGHFVVGIGDPDGYHLVVDPYRHGRVVPPSVLDDLAGVPLGPGALRGWEEVDILQRILANIRRWASTHEHLSIRRRALELALALPRHPLALRSEYGQSLIAAGGYVEGAHALEDFADAIEPADAAAAEAARTDARRARARLN